MPEAAAVLLVFTVCVFVFVMAKIQARNPVHQEPNAVREQLTRERDWLEERLRQAERENWSADMRRPIAEQLEAALRKLSEMDAA